MTLHCFLLLLPLRNTFACSLLTRLIIPTSTSTVVFSRTVLAYTMIFEQNFQSLSSSCSTSSTYYWKDSSSNVLTSCDTSCAFSSSSTTASLLLLADTTSTFTFTISETNYSIIGIDITYVSTSPSITLSFGSTSTTTSTTATYSAFYESGTLTCSNAFSSTQIINARLTATSNIGSSTGVFTIAKTSSSQTLGIRSIRLWVNCSTNCLTCASTAYCSDCMSNFTRHTGFIGSSAVAVCETTADCPTGCLQCYTIGSTSTCVKCQAGYSLDSSTNACNANVLTAAGCSTGYVDSTGACMGYASTGYYQTKSGTAWIQLSSYDSAKYKCLYNELFFAYDYENYELFRCGCDVENCIVCYSAQHCNYCTAGTYYRGDWYDSCGSCSECDSCPTDGSGCSTCASGYTRSSGVCQGSASTPCQTDASFNTSTNKCECNSGYVMDSNSVCQFCQANASYDTATSACYCNSGYTLNTATTTCVANSTTCQSNATYDSSSSSCVCNTGYTFNSLTSACDASTVTCQSNATYNTSTSACECNSGYTLDTATTTCNAITCQSNATYSTTTSACVCNSGYTLDSATTTCYVTCQSHATYNSSTGVCVCNSGYSLDSATTTCYVTCQSHATYNSSTSQCVCDSGYSLYSATNTCYVTCQSNASYNSSTNACVCNSGYTLDSSTTTCHVTCQTNSTYNSSTSACECNSGYSLSGGVCTTTASGTLTPTISQAQSSTGYILTMKYTVTLSTYAGQDIKTAVTLTMASGRTDFTYVVTDISNSEITIQVTPENDFKGQTAQISLADSIFITANNLDSSQQSIALDQFILLSETQKTANSVTGTIGQVASIAIISTILPIAIISNFYVIINTIDLTAFLYYLLFIDVRYPSNVLAFYDFFKNFQFPFIPNIFEYIIDPNYTQESPKPFMNNDTQAYFLSNTGQSVTIAIFIVGIYLIGKALSYFAIPKVQPYLKRAMYETWEYSSFFDLLWTLYIYLVIGAFLQFECYEFSESTYVLNYTIHSFFAVIVTTCPFAISYLLMKQKNLKSDQLFKMKFGALLGGLQLFDEADATNGSNSSSKEDKSIGEQQSPMKSSSALNEENKELNAGMSNTRLFWRVQLTKMYLGILYIRKLIFALIIVYLTNYTYLQLALISILNILIICYIFYVEPLESKQENVKNAIGEMILIAIQICVFNLVEDNADGSESRRYFIGWLIVGMSGFIISWHTIQLIGELFVSCFQSLKRMITNKKKKLDSAKVHALSASAGSGIAGQSENSPLKLRKQGTIDNLIESNDVSMANMNSPLKRKPKLSGGTNIGFDQEKSEQNIAMSQNMMLSSGAITAPSTQRFTDFTARRKRTTILLQKRQSQAGDFDKVRMTNIIGESAGNNEDL